MDKILVILLCLFLGTNLWSQTDTVQNPFDIIGRRGDKDTVTSKPPSTTVNGQRGDTLVLDAPSSMLSTSTLAPKTDSSAILDTAMTGSDPLATSVDSELVQSTDSSLVESPSYRGDPSIANEEMLDTGSPIMNEIMDISENIADLKVSNHNILLVFSILILLLLAALLTVDRSMITKFYRAIANDNYLRFLFREYRSMPWLYWFYFLLFSLNLGFFLYLLASHLNTYYEPTMLLLLGCIGVILLVYLTKHVVLHVLSQIFPVEKEAHLYGFVTMLVNNLLGLVLVPVNLLVAFAPLAVAKWALWLGVAAVLLLYFFRQLKGLFISGKFIALYQFHFFLYLCTAEIAPLLILGKLAVVNFGFH